MDEIALLEQWEQEAQKPFQGWDFSYLAGRYHEERPPWSYEVNVRTVLIHANSVLDMGTGGGEKLLEFQQFLPPDTIATEGYPPNLPIAQANLAPHGIQVVHYDSEQDPRLPFEANRFALILNRHEAYDPDEIARVLQPDGIFITQQVDGQDMADLYSQFGVTSNYPHVTLANFQQELSAAGLQIQVAQEWWGKATFSDVGALVYYLCAVPWEAPADFSVQRYAKQLLALHSGGNLTFNIGRFYLQAFKPR